MVRREFLIRSLASASYLLFESACGPVGASSSVGTETTAVAAVPSVVTATPTPTPTPTPAAVSAFPNLPVREYDQGMGATDATGMVVSFPLRSTGAVQVWVNTATGSTGYNGRSPYPGYRLNGSGSNYQVGATGPGTADAAYGPKSTYADAANSVKPNEDTGEGNQFFFAEGQTFTIDATIANYYHGYSVDYPVCFQSYDPADPLNMAKHGRAGTGTQGARPIWMAGTASFPFVSRGDARDYSNWVFRGIHAISTGNAADFSFTYSVNNVLFENMILDNVELVLQNVNPNPGYTISNNNIVRKIASYGQYDTGGSHTCGIYTHGVNITIEDNVWWHCGWKVGAKRDDPVSAGGPDIFKHCLYLSNGNGTTSLVRRNICADGSAAGLSMRGNHLCHHNVIIDCPTPDFSGGGSGSDTENPNGVLQQAYCQLIMGGDDINSGLPRGMGFSASDGTAESFYKYCLYINNPKFGNVNNQWLIVQNLIAAQPSYMSFEGNRAYSFAPQSKKINITSGPTGAVSSIHVLSDIDNTTSDTSPMTNNQLYSAIGYASKDAAIAAMIADPTQDWAYRILSKAATGFDFNFNRTF